METKTNQTMDQAEKTMVENLHKKTGKTLDEWIAIVKAKAFQKHGEILKFLKEEHGFTHGFANMVALKARAADAGSAENKDELVEKQYKGKEHFRPLYEKLLTEVMKFGKDAEIAPKNNYVSLRRKKQFAILQPSSKQKFEIELNLKGEPASGALQAINSANAMCSHRIILQQNEAPNADTLNWLKAAYERAG